MGSSLGQGRDVALSSPSSHEQLPQVARETYFLYLINLRDP